MSDDDAGPSSVNAVAVHARLRVARLKELLDSLVAGVVRHPATKVVGVYLVAKLALLLLVYSQLKSRDDFLARLSLLKDSGFFHQIAADGYVQADAAGRPRTLLYAFAPLHPALIRLAGASAYAPFVVSNVAAIATIVLVTIMLGARAGLFLALFPSWLAFSTRGLSEPVFTLIVATSFLLHDRGLHLPAGIAASWAMATRYMGAAPFAAVSLFRARLRPREALLFVAPMVVVGCAILLWHYAATGSALIYFQAQRPWGSALTTPWGQYDFYFGRWAERYGRFHGYYALRNYSYAVPALVGVALLWRQGRRDLAVFCAVAVLFAFCVTGMAAISSPRLMLAAFPAIAAVGPLLRPWYAWAAYGAVSLVFAARILTVNMNGGFWG